MTSIQDRKLERVIRKIANKLKEDAKVELGKNNLPVDISTFDIKNPKDTDLNKPGQGDYYCKQKSAGADYNKLKDSLRILAGYEIAAKAKGNRNISFDKQTSPDNWDFMVSTNNDGKGNQISFLQITDDNGTVVFRGTDGTTISNEIFNAADWFVKNDENMKKDINGDVNKETNKKNEIHKMIYSTLVTLSKIIEVAKPDKV